MAKRSKKKQQPVARAGSRTKSWPATQTWLQQEWLWGVGLVVATLLAYQAVWHAGFAWDDDVNITNNTTLRSWHGLWQIWAVPDPSMQYYPLTTSTFWLEYYLWQLNPLGYHTDNVLLHIGDAFLVGIILRKLDVKGAWLAAALFALHPVNVDSVAWVTERKNTLSGMFYLCSLWAALEFWNRRSPDTNGARQSARDWGFYGLAFVLYLAALASKTATVPLPMVILLLLWWKRPRIEFKDLVLLAPFFAAGLAMGLTTLRMEHSEYATTGAGVAASWPERSIIVGKQIWFYFGKLVWPHPLMAMYPRWPINAGQVSMYLPFLAVVGGMLFLWWRRNTSLRPVFVAMAYFLILLFPVSGVFNQNYFRLSFVSDHLQYLASIGPLALAAAGISSIAAPFLTAHAWLRPAGCGIILATLGIVTWFHAQTYRDDETLWKHTLAYNPGSWMGHYNVGNFLERAGRAQEALDHYEQAVILNPKFAPAHDNLGNALLGAGRVDEAIEQYHQALAINPDYVEAHTNLGNALEEAGRSDEAIEQYRLSIRLKPGFASAYNNLGVALKKAGRLPEAVEQYQHAVALEPSLADAHNNLGNTLLQTGRLPEALEQFRQTITLKPDFAEAYNNSGFILGQQGKFAEAIEEFQKALQINPNYTEAQNNLARAQALLLKSNPGQK